MLRFFLAGLTAARKSRGQDMMPRMPSAADKKRWDDLHSAYAKASEAHLAYELELARKYGARFERTWLSVGQKTKLAALQAKKDKIGDKIIDLLVRVSPRGDTWLSGVPSWWLREKLTWEDAIRPKNETLSVVVPGSWGSRDGTMQERKVRTMPKKQDAEEFKKILDKGVILVAGDGDVIDLEDSEQVRVAIMFDVNGFGPHVGAIYAMQRGHVDEALQAADELLEEWTLDHYPDVDPEHFTETFDGRAWTLSVEDFADAIEGTAAEKFIEVSEEEEEEEKTDEKRESVVRDRPEQVDDPDYIIQGFYEDGYAAGDSFGYDDEDEAIRQAQKMDGESWFEGDYVRVITRDGELVWSSEPEEE